jgi:hypothetical protein
MSRTKRSPTAVPAWINVSLSGVERDAIDEAQRRIRDLSELGRFTAELADGAAVDERVPGLATLFGIIADDVAVIDDTLREADARNVGGAR